MRRGMWIGVVLLVILAAVGIAVGAYHVGVNHGLDQVSSGARVVRVVGPGYGYGFPFGLIFLPLLFFGIFFLARGAFWRRRWAGSGLGHHSPEGWGGGRAMFEDWHRRQHEQGAEGPSGSGDEPASA